LGTNGCCRQRTLAAQRAAPARPCWRDRRYPGQPIRSRAASSPGTERGDRLARLRSAPSRPGDQAYLRAGRSSRARRRRGRSAGFRRCRSAGAALPDVLEVVSDARDRLASGCVLPAPHARGPGLRRRRGSWCSRRYRRGRCPTCAGAGPRHVSALRSGLRMAAGRHAAQPQRQHPSQDLSTAASVVCHCGSQAVAAADCAGPDRTTAVIRYGE
jgi:hypothetical protein